PLIPRAAVPLLPAVLVVGAAVPLLAAAFAFGTAVLIRFSVAFALGTALPLGAVLALRTAPLPLRAVLAFGAAPLPFRAAFALGGGPARRFPGLWPVPLPGRLFLGLLFGRPCLGRPGRLPQSGRQLPQPGLHPPAHGVRREVAAGVGFTHWDAREQLHQLVAV